MCHIDKVFDVSLAYAKQYGMLLRVTTLHRKMTFHSSSVFFVSLFDTPLRLSLQRDNYSQSQNKVSSKVKKTREIVC